MQLPSMGERNDKNPIRDNAPSLERGHDRRPEGTAETQAHLGNPNTLEDGAKLRDLALFNLAIDSKLWPVTGLVDTEIRCFHEPEHWNACS
jgi:hypothetical protein